MDYFLDEKPLLMLPGPSEAPEKVIKASTTLLPHYGKEWKRVYEETVELSKKVFDTDEDVILFPVPGSAAIEAAIANFVLPEEKIIIVVNGFFGERASEIARQLGCKVVPVEADYGDIAPPEKLEETLDKNPDAKAVFTVYNETSTGVKNPLEAYSKVVKKSEAALIVDAVSAYGGVELHVDKWSIDCCVGYASKALGGLPGVTPISIKWETLEKSSRERYAWFMNFRVWKRYIEEWGGWGHPHPTSMPTHTILALRRALKHAVEEEGLENIYKRHEVISSAFRAATKAMGLEPLAREEHASPTITAIKLPEGIPRKLIKEMAEKFKILISGGLGKLSGKIVRIGHMGFTATPTKTSQTITALGLTLKNLGLKPQTNHALETFWNSIRGR